MGEHAPPEALQRSHWSEYAVAAGDQVPVEAVSDCATVAEPVIVGSDTTTMPFWTVTVPTCGVVRAPVEETSAIPS
jgi:hypothetical protein